MATVMAAPYAATLLGDYGAEVIKVENPSAPDAIRGWGVVEDKGIQPFWAVVGRNKFPITLNLKVAEGRRILVDLIRQADVLIENMRPGALEKLGIGKDDLLRENPGLIIGTVSGYGQSGPYAGRPGFGTLAEGFSGFTYLNAQPGGPPDQRADGAGRFHRRSPSGICRHDCAAASEAGRRRRANHRSGPLRTLVLHAGAGLFKLPAHRGRPNAQRQRTQLRGAAQQLPHAGRPMGDHVVCGPETLRTPDGVRRAPRDERGSALQDQRGADQGPEPRGSSIRSSPTGWAAGTCRRSSTTCEQLGITIGPIASMRDVAENVHCRERGSMVEMEDPLTGQLLKIPNVPFRLLGTPGRIRFPGLPLGVGQRCHLSRLAGLFQGGIEPCGRRARYEPSGEDARATRGLRQMPANITLMRGNEAIGEGAIRAGCQLFFGYPITPQNELFEYMARYLPPAGGTFLQSESELAGIHMVFGAAGGRRPLHDLLVRAGVHAAERRPLVAGGGPAARRGRMRVHGQGPGSAGSPPPRPITGSAPAAAGTVTTVPGARPGHRPGAL